MNQKREKTCSREKNIFQGGGGGWIFFKFQGETDQEVEGGGDQPSFLGGIALCSREKFFQGELRGVLPSMVTLPLFHLHFQNISLTLCQTKFSKL